jgi:hypothetical protein
MKASMQKIKQLLKFLTLTTMALLAAHCNNYGLLDKLQDPTSGSSTASSKFYAFVHPTVTLGNMSGLVNGGCAGNGLTRADCACQDMAVANGLVKTTGTTFVAWLSGTANTMSCRITGVSGTNCTLPTGGPSWYNTQEEIIASGYQDLFDGIITNPIKYQADKAATAATSVWTGTGINGNLAGTGDGQSTCTDWTSTGTATPVLGSPTAVNASWTNASQGATCGNSNVIYCFQIK